MQIEVPTTPANSLTRLQISMDKNHEFMTSVTWFVSFQAYHRVLIGSRKALNQNRVERVGTIPSTSPLHTDTHTRVVMLLGQGNVRIE